METRGCIPYSRIHVITMSGRCAGARDWRDPDHWFCAELCVWGCEQSGLFAPITALAWPKNRVSPTDLLMIFLQDERWVNRDTFWGHIPGLILGEKER